MTENYLLKISAILKINTIISCTENVVIDKNQISCTFFKFC